MNIYLSTVSLNLGVQKILKVLKSCQTEEQLVSARTMIENYMKLLKKAKIDPKSVENYLIDMYNLRSTDLKFLCLIS